MGSTDGPDGLDCLIMMSTGPFSLARGDSALMSFAVIYGSDYDDLLANAEMAQILYNNRYNIEGDDLSNDDIEFGIPKEFKLNDPYPNPFNPTISISYEVSAISNISFIIYNINGQIIEEFSKEVYSFGKHSFDWDASNYSSGIYFIKMVADGFPSRVKKITLIK